MTDSIEDENENILYDINTYTEWISDTKLTKVIFQSKALININN